MNSKEKRSRGLIKRMVIATAMIAVLIIPEIALADGGDPIAVVNNFYDLLKENGTIEKQPEVNGRNIFLIVNPKNK